MARIRTIKPEFWKHEALSALPEATHMLAAQLLNYADDFGYFNANPALVKAECSPIREPSVSIPESLRSLQEAGWIEIGTTEDGRRIGRIVTFEQHQRVSHPTQSKFAAISTTWDTPEAPPEILRNPPETFGPEREQGTGNREREQGTGKGNAVVALATRTDLDQAIAMFNEMAATTGLSQVQRLTPERRRKLALRLDEAGGIDGWAAACAKVRASEFLCGKNERRWKAGIDFMLQPSSFTKIMEGAYDRARSLRDQTTELLQDIAEGRVHVPVGNSF